MATKQFRALISGRVQGVYFRANTHEVARRHGLVGWVRNLADGRVEVVAQGEEEALHELLTWCHKGPPGAHVRSVEVSWEEGSQPLRGFEIRY